MSMEYDYKVLEDGSIEMYLYKEEKAVIEIPSIIYNRPVTSVSFYHFDGKWQKELYIPKTIKHIYDDGFYGMKRLEKIVVDEENPVYDSRNNCNAIIETATNKLVRASKNTIIPNDIKIIGKNSYQGLNIEKIIIPDNVTIIEDNAFFESPFIKEIKLSKNIVKIGKAAFFASAGLEEIEIPASVEVIGENAFGMCDGLRKITFCNDSKIREIGSMHAFNLKKLEKIDTGNNLNNIITYLILYYIIALDMDLPVEDKDIGVLNKYELEFFMEKAREKEKIILLNRLIAEYHRKYGGGSNLFI